MSDTEQPLIFKINLNVLNHLGINLYSSAPAVLSEVVANAWDADATTVSIDYDEQSQILIIADDGHGMTRQDVQNKYLNVGYQRRKEHALSPKYKRPVMGRKGIGKLSLFSIANKIKIYTIKDEEKTAIEFDVENIKAAIENAETYSVPRINFDNKIQQGTYIEISDFKKHFQKSMNHLRRRMARRFSIIGDKYNFSVSVNGNDVTPADRDYYHKVQFLFTYGEAGKEIEQLCQNYKKHFPRKLNVEGYELTGWIATAKEPHNLKDDDGESINQIPLFIRGKLAEENLLTQFHISGHIRHYLFGEFHVNFLDDDPNIDITTTSRETIQRENQSFQDIQHAIEEELKKIRPIWEEERGKISQTDLIQRVPEIENWIENLKGDAKKVANKLIGVIGQIEEDKRDDLYRAVVPAVEQIKITQNFNILENIETEKLEAILSILKQHDAIEAHLFYEITRSRLKVIKNLLLKVDDNEYEKVIQEYIFDHLWLLDPSWDRASTDATVEQSITTKLNGIKVDGRIDIKYRRTSGEHVIIELKRPGVKPSLGTLIDQIRKYRKAVETLVASGNKQSRVMIFIIVSEYEADEDDFATLEKQNAQIKTYHQVVHNAENQYSDYLKTQSEYSDLTKLIDKISQSLSQNF